jgi:hypothetical protein
MEDIGKFDTRGEFKLVQRHTHLCHHLEWPIELGTQFVMIFDVRDTTSR